MRALAFVLLLATGITAHAQVDNPDAPAETLHPEIEAIKEAEKKCSEKAESNLDMKTCASKTYRAADKLLNKKYKEIMANLDQQIAQEKKDNLSDFEAYGEETKNRLLASQRAWVAFRDAQCQFEGVEMLHGSGESLVVVGCLGRMTLERASELIDFSNREM